VLQRGRLLIKDRRRIELRWVVCRVVMSVVCEGPFLRNAVSMGRLGVVRRSRDRTLSAGAASLRALASAAAIAACVSAARHV